MNAVAPGASETDFGGGAVRTTLRSMPSSPHKRRWAAGVPDDIGGFIAALLADDHRWISGQRIEVSGGMFL